MKKRIISLILSGVMVMGVLSGCGSTSTSGGEASSSNSTSQEATNDAESTVAETEDNASATSEAATAESDKSSGDYVYQDLEDAEISYFNYSIESKDMYEQQIAEYNSIHPNIKINLDLVGGGADVASALKSEISSGQTPNMIALQGISDLVEYQDLLDDLSDQPWVEHVLPNAVDSIKLDGKVVSAPMAVVEFGLLCNKGIFDACGIDIDTLKSYDEIDAAFAKVQKAIDNGDLKDKYTDLEAVVSLPAKEAWSIGMHGSNAFIASELGSGMDAYNADSIDFTYGDAYKDYIDLLVKYTADADNPSALVAVDYDSAMGASFCVEKTAVIQMGQWVQPIIAEVNPDLLDNLGVLPIPVKGADEDNINYDVGAFLVVTNTGTEAQQAASKDFLNWMLMSDEGKKLVTTTFAIPMDNYDDYPVSNQISQLCESYAQSGNTTPLVQGSYPSGWSDLLGAGVQGYISGTETWDQVISDAKEQWSSLRNQ